MVKLLTILTLLLSFNAQAQEDTLGAYHWYFEVPKTIAENWKGTPSEVKFNDIFNYAITNDGKYVVSINALEYYKKRLVKRKLIDAPSWVIRVYLLHSERDFPQDTVTND